MFPAKYPINCPSLNIGPNFLSWPKTNIGILTRRQLEIHSMFITALLLVQPKGYLEPHN